MAFKRSILVGRAKMGNLSNANTKEKLNNIYENAYPERLNAKGNYVGQLNKFVNETKIDDIVLYRYDNLVYIGKIKSEYYFKK